MGTRGDAVTRAGRRPRMRILHVNKFLYRRGGAEAYMLDLASRQEAAGHEVAYFSTRHPENLSSEFEGYFPDYIELNPPPASWRERTRAAARVLYSRSAELGFTRVLERFRPDIVHLHNIYHHLSPSVLRPLRPRAVPAVMTLHDFKLACPTHRFMANGRVCEACVPRRFYMATVKRCHEGSLSMSTLNGVELAAHTLFRLYGPIALFLCPSRFMVTKMTAAHVFSERLRWIPNFVDASTIETKRAAGGGVVYAGRLSEEKGVETLVRAAPHVDAPIDVVGDGPDRAELERLAARLGARNVSFHGHVSRDTVHRLVREASVGVMPSRGYENAPMGILEAFACGVPVVGTAHGGIPELIEPGIDGDLVPPGDDMALAGSLARFTADPAAAFAQGGAARRKVEEGFSPDRHLERLDGLYREAAERASRT
jgi:glycosyltransferase involved in cell wall biosynthesis